MNRKDLEPLLPKNFSTRAINKEIDKKLENLIKNVLSKEKACFFCCCDTQRKNPDTPLTEAETNKLVSILMEIKVAGVIEKDIRDFISSDLFYFFCRQMTALLLGFGSCFYLSSEQRHRGFEIVNASMCMLDLLEQKAKNPKN
jgi:hypothetical protein